MKKIKMMMAALFCCTIMPAVLTSCGGDDDDNDVLPEVAATVKTVTLYITATPTADMLKYADLEIVIADEDGNIKSAVVDSPEFKVRTSYTQFPVNATVKYTQKPKAGVAANAGEGVNWNYELLVQKEMTMSDGTTKMGEPYKRVGTIAIPGENLAKYIESKGTITETSIVIDKNGVIK